MKTPKQQSIKAWAVTSQRGVICQSLSNNGQAAKDYWTYLIHETKADAMRAIYYHMAVDCWKPVAITITLPASPKKPEHKPKVLT